MLHSLLLAITYHCIETEESITCCLLKWLSAVSRWLLTLVKAVLMITFIMLRYQLTDQNLTPNEHRYVTY